MVGDRKTGGERGRAVCVDETKARSDGGQTEHRESGEGDPSTARAVDDRVGERDEGNGGEQPRIHADRVGQRQPPEEQGRSGRPSPPARPARLRARLLSRGRLAPPPPASSRPCRRHLGRRGLAGRRQPGAHREAERDHKVEEHADAEIDRIAERPTHALPLRLRNFAVERNVEPVAASDDQGGHRHAQPRIESEQRPPFAAGAQHRGQHHRQHEPVRPVDHALHALVVRPQAALDADPETRGEQRHRESGREQQQQPRPGRAVLRPCEGQHRPQREHDLDERP